MYQKVSSRDENKVRELSNQIHQLKARLLDYKAQLDLKDNQIHLLNNENLHLKFQLKNQNKQSEIGQYSTSTIKQYSNQTKKSINQGTNQLLTPNQYVDQTSTFIPGKSVNKRQCPQCAAIGSHIKEYDDKKRILSYVPRIIYAKKYVCIKCRYEF